jgi:hypothetical protein
MPTLGFYQDQALNRGALHDEHEGGLHGLGVGVPEAVGGEGHLPEHGAGVHHFEGGLVGAFGPVEAHPALLEDK